MFLYLNKFFTLSVLNRAPIIVVIHVLAFSSCRAPQKSEPDANLCNKLELQEFKFKADLKNRVVIPTFEAKLIDSFIVIQNYTIQRFNTDKGLSIIVNQDTIHCYNLQTLNEVWSGKDSVQYATDISEVKYYKEPNILMLNLYFYPCTGLGCGVSYQLLYYPETQDAYAFGKFRSSCEMEMYSRDQTSDEFYFLSTTFHGRNALQKDTIIFEPFSLIKNRPPKRMNYYAKFMYENIDSLTNIELNWLIE